MTLPADTARCPGVGSDSEGWRDGCESCARRTTEPNGVEPMTPPPIIAFWCEIHIPERDPNTSDLFGDE